MKGCREVTLELGLEMPVEEYLCPPECCGSCHDDFNEGYEDRIWLDDDTAVCCALARLVEEVERKKHG